jgi:hypothetical protein
MHVHSKPARVWMSHTRLIPRTREYTLRARVCVCVCVCCVCVPLQLHEAAAA